MIKDKEEKKPCSHKIIAEEQRDKEREAGLGDEGVRGFYDMGCFNCDYYREGCSSYTPMEKFSMADLKRVLRESESFKKIDPENMEEAREYLDDYCGIKSPLLSEEDYSKRLKNISKVLNN